jgi:hypothetical protein
MVSLYDLFNYVLFAAAKYQIDDSHGVSHSMDVLQFSHNIYKSEVFKAPYLKDQEHIIYTAAVLHDMCDKKYMNETLGLDDIEKFLKIRFNENDIDITKKIISTMSYSKVKKDGFPDLGDYQKAYHIVREADLLSAYDFDRCMIFHLYNGTQDINNAYDNALELFNKRVFKHNDDNLLLSTYAKRQSMELTNKAINRIKVWKKILKK